MKGENLYIRKKIIPGIIGFDIKEILKMSPSKRIILAQEIWDSVPEDSIEISQGIKEQLDNRLKLHRSNEMEYFTHDEIKKKLAQEREKY